MYGDGMNASSRDLFGQTVSDNNYPDLNKLVKLAMNNGTWRTPEQGGIQVGDALVWFSSPELDAQTVVTVADRGTVTTRIGDMTLWYPDWQRTSGIDGWIDMSASDACVR